MKMKMKEEYGDDDIAAISNRPTPKLDALVKDVIKLLAAGVATFIPKACRALKDDWVPKMSDEVLKQNPALQQEMRNKIMRTFAKEYNPDGVWKQATIENYLEDFLTYRGYQEGNDSEKSKKAREAKAYQKNLERSGISKNLAQVCAKSGEPPKEDEEEEEKSTSRAIGQSQSSSKKYQPTPQELYESGVTDAEKLWTDLTGLDDLITSEQTDPLIDFIKPTRQYRLRIFKGLDEQRSIHYQNCLIRLDMLIQDTLKMSQEISRDKRQQVSN